MIGGRKECEEWCAYDFAFALQEGVPVLISVEMFQHSFPSNDGGKCDDLMFLMMRNKDMTCYNRVQLVFSIPSSQMLDYL